MEDQSVKKVLFILHYPPPVHGAAMVGKYIRESQDINTTFKCDYINLGTSVSVDDIGKGGWSKVKRFFQILKETYRSLKNFRPNLVYITLTSTGIGFFKDALVVLLIRLFRIQMVYHFHNKGVSNKQNKWVYNLIYKFVFKKCKVILLAPPLYSDIQKYIPESKVYYCPNGVPEIRGFEIKEQKQNGKPQILFLSNLIESKGVQTLIDACKVLKDRSIDFSCVFIGGEGDISEGQFQSRVEELQLQNDIFYLGKKYGKDKDEAYRNADIFALPTHYDNECFPLVLLEAMQYGLPIVSTPEGAIAAIVEEGQSGFLVKQKNSEQLANRLEQLIASPTLRSEMGVKGRNFYLQEFTLKKFEDNLTGILKRIV
ncbi:glycosyltransferase family 4 protein [Maribacter algarum]|uniref:Glycosyltransferase family 4 protein n=1 Tax=Maribacter algarum (ex Zhang et al. 2020) TaxID=2578118 RepID=A0A5S3PT86_9FLAO|nr:glycosyltransferase [Maribacter algarum]TMM58201.1 glycosyltransferase family 4 protein [Maribacter algarum]